MLKNDVLVERCREKGNRAVNNGNYFQKLLAGCLRPWRDEG
jgi:hypothetical protein